MACSQQAGVRVFLDFIESESGEKITQSEWHAIRQLAAEQSGGKLSRAKANPDDAHDAALELAQLLNYEQGIHYGNDADGDAVEDYRADRLIESVAGVKCTEGTLAAIRRITTHGIKESLAEVRAGSENSPASDTGLGDMTPPELVNREWANEVYWPKVPVEEREAFAWAMESNVLKFYGASYSEDDNDYHDYSDVDLAGEVSHILHTAQNDLDENVTINRLATETQLREYTYLTEDGGDSPAVQVWQEWKANGVG